MTEVRIRETRHPPPHVVSSPPSPRASRRAASAGALSLAGWAAAAICALAVWQLSVDGSHLPAELLVLRHTPSWGPALRADPFRFGAYNVTLMALGKRRLQSNDSRVVPAARAMVAYADALLHGPAYFSVANKSLLPPSGDPHDYTSTAYYAWPCNALPGNFTLDHPRFFVRGRRPECNTSSGEPWASVDGTPNLAAKAAGDFGAWCSFHESFVHLTVSFYFTGDERYASRALHLLRAWFIDAPTRMNPNLDYAQRRPGATNGSIHGMIDISERVHGILDGVRILEQQSTGWTEWDGRQLRKWFSAFLRWLLTTSLAVDEAAATNNHVTYFDAQVMAVALFVGDAAVLRRFARKGPALIDFQFAPSGELWQETARPRSLWYARFGLVAMFLLGGLARQGVIDLFEYTSAANGSSIRQGLDFMLPFMLAPQTQRPHAHEDPEFHWALFFPMLLQASAIWSERSYLDAAARLSTCHLHGPTRSCPPGNFTLDIANLMWLPPD